MNPRASAEATSSIGLPQNCTARPATTARNTTGLPSNGVMSLNRMPGLGKSGTSRIQSRGSIELGSLIPVSGDDQGAGVSGPAPGYRTEIPPIRLGLAVELVLECIRQVPGRSDDPVRAGRGPRGRGKANFA